MVLEGLPIRAQARVLPGRQTEELPVEAPEYGPIGAPTSAPTPAEEGLPDGAAQVPPASDNVRYPEAHEGGLDLVANGVCEKKARGTALLGNDRWVTGCALYTGGILTATLSSSC